MHVHHLQLSLIRFSSLCRLGREILFTLGYKLQRWCVVSQKLRVLDRSTAVTAQWKHTC